MAPEKNKFQKLTPVHDAKLSIYKDALDFVFENADIKTLLSLVLTAQEKVASFSKEQYISGRFGIAIPNSCPLYLEF